VEIKRGPAAFPLDHDLSCDPFLSRYKNWVTAQVRPFQPDLVHITGPGDIGILGLWVAHTLRVPLVASWHTNLHEYAGRRLNKLLRDLPDAWRERVSATAEEQSLRACLRFYGLARFLLAPNEAMVHLLHERTGKPAFLMAHGVDTETFSPQRPLPPGRHVFDRVCGPAHSGEECAPVRRPGEKSPGTGPAQFPFHPDR
jgi:phosphatidylinositol alpha 1,6-mannosyltransferase